MILSSFTRVYVSLATLILLEFTGLLFENFNKNLYVFIPILAGGFIGLVALGYCSNIHQKVIYESKIEKSLFLKIKIGWGIGFIAAISPVFLDPKILLVVTPHIVIPSILVLSYIIRWWNVSKMA